jgi:predicted phosphodiesterase
MESTLLQVAAEMALSNPDFSVNLGDMLDFHPFGFNSPPPDGLYTRLGYLNYRRLLGDALGNASHFVVIGNWDGENGDFTAEEIQRSRQQRLRYAPGPGPGTYPQGGSEHEDYYAFAWGDALFVVLNVMTYTPTTHLLSTSPGVADDWTLGDAQLQWLRTTLEEATSKWRFLLIHHAVGGAAGDAANSAYGRGGGQAAGIGEQAVVHELMLQHDVQIFFYGHDHVFTDMVVDGIHYTLPGSAGAPWKFVTAETGYTEYWSDSGHARVHVGPARVEVELVALGGEVIHRYQIE